MNVSGYILRPFYWLASRLFATWARPVIQPESPAELIADSNACICYVLESGGLADLLALERACRLSGLPSPHESLEFGGRAIFSGASSCCGRCRDSSSVARQRPGQDGYGSSWMRARITTRNCCSFRWRSTGGGRPTKNGRSSSCCSRKTGMWSGAQESFSPPCTARAQYAASLQSRAGAERYRTRWGRGADRIPQSVSNSARALPATSRRDGWPGLVAPANAR